MEISGSLYDMNAWLRGFAAIMMGLIVAFAVTFGIEWINNQVYPLQLPPGASSRDPAVIKAAIAELPPPALVVVLAGWFLAALAGSWVATRIARGDHRAAWFLGVLLVAAAIGNMLAIPHPVWFWVAALALYPLGIGLGARIGSGAVTPAC
jgi:hypothetical protein